MRFEFDILEFQTFGEVGVHKVGIFDLYITNCVQIEDARSNLYQVLCGHLLIMHPMPAVRRFPKCDR